MGRATRWLKSLLGWKKDGSAAAHSSGASDPPREKKRWSFTKPPKDGGELGRGGGGPGLHGSTAAVASLDSAWLRNYYNNREKEQSKHAIVVAAATTAAADAAVATTQGLLRSSALLVRGPDNYFLPMRELEEITRAGPPI